MLMVLLGTVPATMTFRCAIAVAKDLRNPSHELRDCFPIRFALLLSANVVSLLLCLVVGNLMKLANLMENGEISRST